jgi:hypothetical protein
MRKTHYGWRFPLIIAAFVACLGTPASAQENRFSSGTVRFSGSVSANAGFGGNSFQLGLGAGYYVLDGLELGLDARSWFGGDYNVHELEPALTYVFTNFGRFKPYGGVLYRRTFIEGRDDLSAYGGRGGILLQQSRDMHLRAGITGIRYLDCDSDGQSDCSEFYPEVSVGFYF